MSSNPPRSKYVSWLLRHGAVTVGVSIEPDGWVEVEDVLRASNLTRDELEQIVATDQKQRFECAGSRIRACQGHSNDSGVSIDALEASWTPYLSNDSIWHGTSRNNISDIARDGVLPLQRTHVHCALSKESVVGKRANVDLLLEISPAKLRAAGLDIFVSSNGVVLVRRVPREAIVNLIPMTKAARKSEGEMRTIFGLEHRFSAD